MCPEPQCCTSKLTLSSTLRHRHQAGEQFHGLDTTEAGRDPNAKHLPIEVSGSSKEDVVGAGSFRARTHSDGTQRIGTGTCPPRDAQRIDVVAVPNPSEGTMSHRRISERISDFYSNCLLDVLRADYPVYIAAAPGDGEDDR